MSLLRLLTIFGIWYFSIDLVLFTLTFYRFYCSSLSSSSSNQRRASRCVTMVCSITGWLVTKASHAVKYSDFSFSMINHFFDIVSLIRSFLIWVAVVFITFFWCVAGNFINFIFPRMPSPFYTVDSKDCVYLVLGNFDVFRAYADDGVRAQPLR